MFEFWVFLKIGYTVPHKQSHWMGKLTASHPFFCGYYIICSEKPMWVSLGVKPPKGMYVDEFGKLESKIVLILFDLVTHRGDYAVCFTVFQTWWPFMFIQLWVIQLGSVLLFKHDSRNELTMLKKHINNDQPRELYDLIVGNGHGSWSWIWMNFGDEYLWPMSHSWVSMFEHDYSSIYEPFIYESLWAIHNILTESPDSWIYQPWLLVNCPVFLEKEGDGKDDKGCVSCKAQKNTPKTPEPSRCCAGWKS